MFVRMSKIGLEIREMLAPRPWRNPCLQIFAKTTYRTEKFLRPSICQGS